ncbi:hypothetical protein CK203_041735 [Vitis vinifera]|uniref:Endonuclease/exonuclease/phosphatase domain-containing protein n=1 Tax=Vitis vinifera TaxID=29760 RepID=A0A438HCT1_VITVI|nr:hypothetical protein CK203_041735 [Vitis vinifera]
MGSKKEDFWEELGAICGLWDDPWCIGGDFNAVRFPEERRNAPRLIAEMRRFSEVIRELGLRDFPLAGGPFPWIGGLNSQAASRLDHFLISTNGRTTFLPSHNLLSLVWSLRWEAKENENSLTPGDVEAKNLALEDYKKWALLEETSWR